jgi:hypothetical protein
MPTTTDLLRSRLVHLGGFVLGVAIGERIFRPGADRASGFGWLVTVGREEALAARGELGRANDARLAAVVGRALAGNRSIGRPIPGRRPGRWSRANVTSGMRERT